MAKNAQSKKQTTTKSEKKSSAFYQRQYRQRLREQGLVKKEVWILPDNNKVLLGVEKVLRQYHDNMSKAVSSALENTTTDHVKNTDTHTEVNSLTFNENISLITGRTKNDTTSNSAYWQTRTLYEELKKAEFFTENHASIELIEGIYSTIYINMHDFGDLPIFINVTGEQILVESLLFAVDDIADKQAFNTVVLRTHKYFPLSTISLDKIGDDGEYYQMFGSLSSTSNLQEVLIEIELLAHNVLQATEAYSAFFKETS